MEFPPIHDFLSEAEEDVSVAYVLLNLASPSKAISQLDRVIKNLRRRISFEHVELIRKELYRLLSSALVAKMACNAQFQPRDSVEAVVRADFFEADWLARETGDAKLEAWANFWYGGCYYLGHHWLNSSYYIEKSLVKTNAAEVLAEALRIMMLNYANSGQHNNFQTIETRVLDKLWRGQFNAATDRAALLEGMGQGRALLGLPYAKSRLNDAESECELSDFEHQPKVVRSLQIARSRLVLLSTEEKLDVDEFERIAYDGIRIAQAHNQARYARDIELQARKLGINIRMNNTE